MRTSLSHVKVSSQDVTTHFQDWAFYQCHFYPSNLLVILVKDKDGSPTCHEELLMYSSLGLCWHNSETEVISDTCYETEQLVLCRAPLKFLSCDR